MLPLAFTVPPGRAASTWVSVRARVGARVRARVGAREGWNQG